MMRFEPSARATAPLALATAMGQRAPVCRLAVSGMCMGTVLLRACLFSFLVLFGCLVVGCDGASAAHAGATRVGQAKEAAAGVNEQAVATDEATTGQEDFVPSEEVSADRSISFPVDI